MQDWPVPLQDVNDDLLKCGVCGGYLGLVAQVLTMYPPRLWNFHFHFMGDVAYALSKAVHSLGHFAFWCFCLCPLFGLSMHEINELVGPFVMYFRVSPVCNFICCFLTMFDRIFSQPPLKGQVT